MKYSDLSSFFYTLITKKPKIWGWLGKYTFDVVWCIDVGEEFIWNNKNTAEELTQQLEEIEQSSAENVLEDNSKFFKDLSLFIASKRKKTTFTYQQNDKIKTIEIRQFKFKEKKYILALEKIRKRKKELMSFLDEVSYYKKLNQVYEKTNELAQVGGWLVDLVNQQILWTKVTKDIHEVPSNYEPDLTTGIDFYKEGENRERIGKVFTDVVENGGFYQDDFQLITAKGNEITVRVYGKAEQENGKTVRVYGSFQDITEQRKKEQELAITQLRFKDIFDNSPLGIIMVKPDNSVFHVNQSALDIFGLRDIEKEEIFKLSFKDVIHEDHLELAVKKRKQLLAGKFNSYKLESKYYKKNGEEFWAQTHTSLLQDSDGTPRAIITQIEDITERKKLEFTSRKNAQDFKSAFDYSPNGMALVGLNGEWLRVNHNISKMLGYSGEELRGMSFMEITHPDDLDSDLNELRKLLEGEINSYTIEKRYIHKNGSFFWGLLTVSLLWDENNEPLYFISQINDITAIKQAQQETQKALLEFHNLMEATTQVSIIEANIDGVVTKFNKGAENYLGYKAEEIIGKKKVFLFHKEDEMKKRSEYLSNKYGRKIEGFEIFTFKAHLRNYDALEWTYVKKDGSTLTVQLVITAIRNAEGKVTSYLGISTDISLLKSIETELRKSEERWQFALEGSGDGVWDWNIPENQQYLSNQAKEMLGFSESDQLSNVKHWDNRIHPEDRKRSDRALQDYFEGKKAVYHVEKRVKCKDGNYKWIMDRGTVMEWSDEGKPIRMLGTQTDITDRKIAEKKIRQNEAKFRSLYELSPIGIVLISIKTRKLTGANDSFIKSSGYSLEELLEFQFEVLLNDRYLAEVNQLFDELVAGSRVNNFEAEILKKDGSSFPVIINCIKIKDTNGEDVMLSTIQDITQRKEMENSLVDAKFKAEAASRSKSEFLANMSHEIRTPLNGVIGFTDLLMKTELNKNQRQYMETVYISANTLLDLINDILDFSKIEAGKLEFNIERVDIFDLCQETIDVIKYKAHEKGLEVLLNINPEIDRYIYGDPIRIRQILINLLGNAVKFTENGEIELKIEAQQETEQKDKSIYKFSVRDTGIGIAPKNIERIFKAFDQEDSSTTRKYGGTGLGLTITNKLLALMDSELQVKSELGAGSEFCFAINFKTENGAFSENDNLDNINRILIVDDNYQNQIILKEMLTIKNIACEMASNAIEALQVVENDTNFDAAIVDFNMPYMTGLDFIDHLRNELKINAEKLPIILLHSSSEEESITKKAKLLKVNSVLTKPIKTDHLYRMLNQIHTPQQNTSEASIPEVKEDQFQAKFKILVAEDNPVNTFLAKTILLKVMPNAEILTVENGQEAVTSYQENQSKLDIIFMDIQMPIKSGFEATTDIREFEVANNLQPIPIIALTARTVKGERERCIDAGMTDYITKPVILDTIKGMIKSYLIDSDFSEEIKNTDLEEATVQHFDKQALLSKFDDNLESYHQLLQIVVVSFEENLSKLQQSIRAKDLLELQKIGHKLKGSAQNCCFFQLEKLAAKLENIVVFEEAAILQLEKEIKEEIDLLKKQF